jgi:hypothetical protein
MTTLVSTRPSDGLEVAAKGPPPITAHLWVAAFLFGCITLYVSLAAMHF